ncbi:MAG: TlpA disulfide reductase family protein [Sedimentisphaerales bacterium]|nr:TlpA disulfide reductase family protein [Sedimentisphaerales bacterium]
MKLYNLILVGGVVCLQIAAVAVGAPAAGIELSTTQWVTQNPPSSEELNGNVYVVEFWATWCPPCRDQIPHMKSLAKKYEDRNVVFIGLSADQSVDEVRAFVEKKKINYHIGMDKGLGDKLGVRGIPTAMIVGHDGRILWNGHPADARFEEMLSSAVKAAPKPMLAGVDLGRFAYLRIKLCGGKSFAKAYTEVDAYTQKADSPDQTVANTIITTINGKIRQKIDAAEQIRTSNPQAAMLMYKQIIDSYGGIRLTKEIEPHYIELKQKLAKQINKTPNTQARADL